MMRTYIAKDRLFRLLVTVGDEASKAAANRFLDSLKLAESEAVRSEIMASDTAHLPRGRDHEVMRRAPSEWRGRAAT